jgi:hypothetical protein
MHLTVTLLAAAGLALPQAPTGMPAPTGRDTVVAVVFSAVGGSVTRSGLYTAGASAGTGRIVAASGKVADTMSVRVAGAPVTAAAIAPPPTPAAGGLGIPFGPFGAWQGVSLRSNADRFSLGLGADKVEDITRRIAAARSARKKLLLVMTGGHHRNYKTAGAFDFRKWQATMEGFNTTAIRQAVAEGVADGTIIGTSVMDEPHNTSSENSWGPPGTMTKARVDEMCGYVKTIFPTLPVGVVHDYRVFEPETNYAVCDFVVSQYREAKGSVTAFRDGGLAFARRSGVAIAFSLNILDGGTRMSGCPVPATGGRGTMGGNCRMTPEQVREYALALGPAGCALTLWRFDPDYMANPENQRVFTEIQTHLATFPARSCRRSSPATAP